MSTFDTILQGSMDTADTLYKGNETYKQYRKTTESKAASKTDVSARESSGSQFLVTSRISKITVVYNSVKEKRKRDRMAFNRGE